ncbi:MAG: gamma-glutamyl-gamma-aminobutyrate hydrolase family protein [Acidobacteriaceae bacterium]|nr:gamma-glutamyl-gamma-aminobutyrate hydrolase family protein [Acidobacteriaceae bacterium]MBV9781048.1 gamma-glutamyl-gamma-aminobutyrate hydrolase family protein [Acidobacteriaceae bacterium]
MNRRVLIPYSHAKKVIAYADAARAAGLTSEPVEAKGAVSINGFAGLLLMGGADVNPRLYGDEVHRKTERPEDERDRVELDLIHEAIQRDLPIVAICRGLQILNVYHGGTLIQHLSTAERHDPDHTNAALIAHEVTIEPGTLLADIAGANSLQVNSRHHQAANRIGAGLHISARDSEDGTVEALERRDKQFVLAVQWHPEDQVFKRPEQMRLFQRFAEACG